MRVGRLCRFLSVQYLIDRSYCFVLGPLCRPILPLSLHSRHGRLFPISFGVVGVVVVTAFVAGMSPVVLPLGQKDIRSIQVIGKRDERKRGGCWVIT